MYTVNATWEINEQQLLRIDLALDGNPFPSLASFSWQFNGVPLVSSGDLEVNLTYLDLGVASRTEGGTYFVEATNIAGRGNATFVVIVYCESPQLSSITKVCLVM